MIGINQPCPKIGNRLFQLGAAISLAKDNQTTVLIPDWKYNKYFINLNRDEEIKLPFLYKEPYFHYKKIPYRNKMAINGYFQSEKYFIHNKDYIQSFLKLKEQYQHTKLENTCAIHVRRGDYLNLPDHHPVSTINYYELAIDHMKKINSSLKFLLFSDDREWCKKNFRIPIYEGKDEIEDFSKMQACDFHVIANSSFSWWAAWLANSKKTIAPKKWFGPAYNHNTKDIIPENWITI